MIPEGPILNSGPTASCKTERLKLHLSLCSKLRKLTTQLLLKPNKSKAGTKLPPSEEATANTAEIHSELWSKVIRETQVSQKQCQDSDLATVTPCAGYGNLGTSGKSLGELLAAGLGDGVRPE